MPSMTDTVDLIGCKEGVGGRVCSSSRLVFVRGRGVGIRDSRDVGRLGVSSSKGGEAGVSTGEVSDEDASTELVRNGSWARSVEGLLVGDRARLAYVLSR